jgi:MoaA/NifB/PqqE/SkfB family radical SAM enzyme
MTKESSYIAASTIPTKLLHNKVLDGKRVVPLHLQLIPTNACNLNCNFCSCSDSDRKKFLTLEQMMDVIDVTSERGTKAITITGGGEPLMHPQLNEMIRYSKIQGMEVGLTTNGILLDTLKKHSNITWCRVSSADDRKPAYKTIEKAVKLNPEVDWAFAHVVTTEPNYDIIKGLVKFANKHKLSHIKLHPDLFNVGKVPMKRVKESLKKMDTSRVVYQDRENVTKGTKNCYISLLKPMVSPEGVFPCCGVQYAIKGSKRDMIDEMKFGEVKDLGKILDKQAPFDGKKCDVCYYSQYNDALFKLKDKPEHRYFV